MSLILDALRKMEQERKARKQASTGMRQEVLNYRGSNPKPYKPILIPVVAGSLLTMAAIGIYFYFGGSSGSRAPIVVAPINPPIQPVPQQVPLPSPVAVPLQQQEQQQKSVEMLQEKPRPKTAPIIKQSEPVQIAGDSSIVVSGIAWQEERGLRRAVINGQLVGEGAEIQGARIVEIRENRIKFNRSGSIFEINYP